MAQCIEQERQRGSRLSWVLVLGIPLVVYLRYAIKLAILSQEYALGDAVCYIRRALYICRGDFYHSISGYWSPLISWSIAPLMYFGMDGLYAARAVLCIWGAVLVITFGLLLYQFTWLNDFWRLGILATVAMATAEVAGNYITPDVMVAACLFAYFAVILHPEVMRRRGLQSLAGLLGGVAYLAKAYAFPFVLVHLPVTLVIRRWSWRSVTRRGEMLRAWAMAMLGWAAIVGPWVGILSWRYGRVTFSTSGARAHAYVGPLYGRSLPEFGPPPDPYIVAWENPETIEHPFWSPFGSRENFEWQLTVVHDNALTMRDSFRRIDRLHLAWYGLAASPVLLVFGRRGERWRGVWVLLTMALYASGYLLVYFADRYIWFMIWPMSALLCMSLILGPRLPGDRNRWVGRLWKVGQCAIAGLVLASFVIGARRLIRERSKISSPAIYRRIAEGILSIGLKGSIAGNHALKSYPVAMHLDEKFLLFPADDDLEVIEKKLREAKTGMLLVWGSQRPSYEPENLTPNIRRLVQRPSWKRVEVPGIGGAEVYVPADFGDKKD